MKIVGQDCRFALFKESYQDNLSRCSGMAKLILTSPPYADARTYGNEVSWTLKDYQELGDYIKIALAEDGHAFVVIGAPVRNWRKGFGTERGLYVQEVILDWANRVGLRIPDILYYKRRGAPGLYNQRWRCDIETIIWAQKPKSKDNKPYFAKDELAEPALYTKIGKNVAVRKKDGTFLNRPASGKMTEANMRHRGNVWDYGTSGHGHTGDPHQTAAKHPASFSLKLGEDAVKCFCPPGGLVVDPFLGGGTSAIAALKNGRKFIGGDLFDRADGVPWIEVAHERIRKWGLQ